MTHLATTVLAISTKYLGPAAGVFLQRQAKSHMNVGLDDLLPEHLPILLYWIHVSASLLIDKKADDLAAELSRVLGVREASSARG